MADHNEIKLEDYIVKKLKESGWKEGKAEHYDRQLALYPKDVIGWIQDTNPKAWEALKKRNGERTEKEILIRLESILNNKKSGGTLKALRQGIKIVGAGQIDMIQAAPQDNENKTLIKKYEANRLRVVRQLKYHPTRELAIDLVFFINGIPVATVELKTEFTQTIEDAKTQYMKDRLPKDKGRTEPLLTEGRGAIVHFAMTDSEIAMTTKLDGEATRFIPFNRGGDPDNLARNPKRDDGEYPVAYFWEEICRPDNWLRIFTNFVYVETKDKTDDRGRPYKDETLIFPRYHQFEAVNAMIADAKKNGPGMQYLNEHSAGSGKTSTIAWTAHDLISLRNDQGKQMFDSVIIVTDRTVLDAQLQDAVRQLDHQFGVIETITREGFGSSKSEQLAKALQKKVPIIVVTIQTFPYAMEHILTNKSLKDRHYAIIMDEAHTSQTGSAAHGLRAALSLDTAKKMEEMDADELLLEIQRSRKLPENVSHFAFTATPKHATMMLFGRRPDPDGLDDDPSNQPRAFHRYTQRQAIEEGFILDVLENYTPYKTAFAIGKKNGAALDKRVDAGAARKALAQYASLHPTHVKRKVAFIVEHFEKNVAGLLGGDAKAMVVTSGRPQAVKYHLAFNRYFEEHGNKYRALVAFSGKVEGDKLGEDDPDAPLGIDPEKEYDESNMNPDLKGKELRHAFDQDEYRVMIVANKFQTGFNQPKLVAMYIDKRLTGIEAVQTLSRLNRTYPGKDRTYVIDFVNDPQEILQAFRNYDEGADIEETQDLNVVYDIKTQLDDAGIYSHADVETFKEARGKFLGRRSKKGSDNHKILFASTQDATTRFNSQYGDLVAEIADIDKEIDQAQKVKDEEKVTYFEGKRSEVSRDLEELNQFKSKLARFVKVYFYIAQLVELEDPELENFAGFAKLLSRRLRGMAQETVDLDGIILSEPKFLLKDMPEEVEKDDLKGVRAGESEAKERKKVLISEIIEKMNDVMGHNEDPIRKKTIVDELLHQIGENETIQKQVGANSTKSQLLMGDLPDVIKSEVVKGMISRQSMSQTLLKDQQNMQGLVGLIADLLTDPELLEAYREIS